MMHETDLIRVKQLLAAALESSNVRHIHGNVALADAKLDEYIHKAGGTKIKRWWQR